ncbi:MAG: cupin domain-containing protein [Caldilineaceae bacterium]|nr:cupin domain-containing protein [Caldilineaceae bacterium]
MRTFQPLENVEYHDANPYAYPLQVDEHGRILRFALKPGQVVREHNAPHSPVYLFVLEGTGLFAGGDGVEREFGPFTLLTFEPGEQHEIRAQKEELVFLAFLHGSPIP